MRRLIFIFCMFYILSAASQNRKKETDLVIQSMQAQETLWNKGDIRGFMGYYWNNDSLTFIGRTGINYGWKVTLDNYLKSYPTKEKMGQLSFTVLEATLLSESLVYIIGKWDLKKENPAGGHFTLLWRKIKGTWLIVSDHTS